MVRHHFERPHQGGVIPGRPAVRRTRIEQSCAVAVLGSDTPSWRALVRARLRSFWCNAMRKPG